MAKDKKDFVEDEQSKEPQFSEIKETIIDENIPFSFLTHGYIILYVNSFLFIHRTILSK